MREIIVSDAAQRVIDSFNAEHHAEYLRVTDYLLHFLKPLVRRGLARPTSLWGIRNPYRYWDGVFPYVIFFAVDKCAADDCVFIYVIVPSPVEPPRQVRI